MKQIDLTNAAGKTIAAVFDMPDSQCLLVFDDDTYAKIEGGGDSDFDSLYTFAEFDLIYSEQLWPKFLELGLITQADIDARLAVVALREEQSRSYRRAQYENLKKEFGDERKE